MGQPRNTPASQRECLVRLASKFERIVRDALDGRYEGSTLFAERPELKLATKIIGLNGLAIIERAHMAVPKRGRDQHQNVNRTKAFRGR
jgi:hypothetical protein